MCRVTVASRIVKRGDVAMLGSTPIDTVPVKTGELRKGGKGFKRKAPQGEVKREVRSGVGRRDRGSEGGD